MDYLSKSMSEILIRSLVKRAIKDIRESPERSTRNLVDMALNFSNGRFQTHFLKTAQKCCVMNTVPIMDWFRTLPSM